MTLIPEAMTPTEFKAIRERLGLTQRQLAAVMGVTQSAIARWEADPSEEYSREVGATTAGLMRAYEQGHRPPNWPEDA
jgi:transcriptional regulator with XRE-family HTH domain